ncbi:hypothetical protein WAI453_005263 [Rhynchosporium graminicola]
MSSCRNHFRGSIHDHQLLIAHCTSSFKKAHPQVASQPAPYQPAPYQQPQYQQSPYQQAPYQQPQYQQAPYQPNYFHKYATMPQAPAIMSTSTLPHLMPSQLLARPKVRLAGEAFRQFLKAKYEKRVAKRAAKAAVVKVRNSSGN